MDASYDLDILFADGRGVKHYKNVIAEHDLGPWFVVVLAERTPTGNNRQIKHHRKRIFSVETEHRSHLATTKGVS